ncbi:MAG: hypothetical protein JSW20_06200 [Nitrospiraceae bacterium]|nr:MAG: hypothetical protein JSW20_06200 [Nitrospiraceae bacterium]
MYIHGNFKTVPAKVLEAVHGTLEYCVEVSRFIVPENPFYKNHEITLRLCREMIKMSIKIGVTHAFLSIDHKFYRMLKILGFPITEIGKSKLYMGSVTTPGVLTLQDLLPQLKIKKPSLYDFMAAEGDMAMETSHV